MSDQHVGVRRRPSRVPVRRVVPLAAGLAMVFWALALGEPSRDPGTVPAAVVPTWTGPETVDTAGVLPDGASYTPRLYISPEVSIGVATGADGSVRVMLARSPADFTELRARPAQDRAQINGFATDGDSVVWLETTARSGGGSASALWRASLSGGGPPAQVTTNTGETSFYGIATEVQLVGGRVSWTALAPTQTVRTEIRSVALAGGQVSTERVDGEFLLSARPWATSLPGGSGTPVTLLNLDTGERRTFATGSNESAICDPAWCRIAVTAESGLIGVDLAHPDGSSRRRIAGPEATPVISRPVLLDRYVPLAIDRDDGIGLSLFDVSTGETEVIAQRAANVGGHGSVLWWSTGVGSELTWHALDLSRLP